MITTWNGMSMVIDRYERLAMGQLKDLKTFQKRIMQFPMEDSRSIRRQMYQLENQLESGLKQLLTEKENLDETSQRLFDERVDPIRKQILNTLNEVKSLPPLRMLSLCDSLTTGDDVNPYEAESERYSQEADNRLHETKTKAEEARLKAGATAQLNKDIRDLEDVFIELARCVHDQHEVVDSIEEHIEKAAYDIQHGKEQLKKAVKHKTSQVPIVAAAAGSVAVGGPVGIFAGSALTGIIAGVGGLFAGIYGGKLFRSTVKKDCDIDS